MKRYDQKIYIIARNSLSTESESSTFTAGGPPHDSTVGCLTRDSPSGLGCFSAPGAPHSLCLVELFTRKARRFETKWRYSG